MYFRSLRFLRLGLDAPFGPLLFLARAYVLSSRLNPENLARAESILDELINTIPLDDVTVSLRQLPVIIVPNLYPGEGHRKSSTALVETRGP